MPDPLPDSVIAIGVDPAGRAWLAALARVLEETAELWELEVGDPFPDASASLTLHAVRADGVDKIRFGWAGSEKHGEGHYYCIQGPSFQIEFINVQADSAGNPANHIHSAWRRIEGDFGMSAK